MKIHIYNENCVQAGRLAHDDRYETWDDLVYDWDDCGDVTVYEGTPEELLELADMMSADRKSTRYTRRVAETIRDAVYFERPDLEPVEADDD